MIARVRRHLRAAIAAAPFVLVAISVVISIALYAASVIARPGGGQTFGGRGGGSSSSGGHSGSGGGDGGCAIDILFFFVELTVDHPRIGVPLDAVLLILLIVALRQNQQKKNDWTTTRAALEEASRPRASRAVRRELLTAVTRNDPDFSLVLFEDFLYALYAAVHEARGRGQLDSIAAYLRRPARDALSARAGLSEVLTTVIGALRYVELDAGTDTSPVVVTVVIEANYTEVSHEGRHHTFYVVERWSLSRARTARSRPPEKASIIGCPNCGAPLSGMRGNHCSYCQQVVDSGAFDWMVESIVETDRMERPPQLTSDTEERGTSLRTVVDPGLSIDFAALAHKDPTFSWPHFLSRVGAVFTELQPAWSTREWTRARPFVTDPLFQMLAYWIESYKRAHLRNVTENARILGIEAASLISDRYYDAITVRVRATGLDYTVDDDGKLVSGSRDRPRTYTEYWTLIRGAGTRTKLDTQDNACPNCGAPLAITMSGSCTHCNAKVTAGEFDWVLSRIEQDEAYTG